MSPSRAGEPWGSWISAVERNAYGRQIDSRVVEIALEPEFESPHRPGKLEAVFIRAPIIRRVGPSAHVLAEYRGDPVLVEQGRHLVATFHPELTSDPRVHAALPGEIVSPRKDAFCSCALATPAAAKWRRGSPGTMGPTR